MSFKSKKLSGISLLEVLFGILIIAIVGLLLSRILSMTYYTHKKVEVAAAADLLVTNKLEELASLGVATLSDGDDLTENNLTGLGTDITFTRVTDVTVNADQSVTLNVSVTSEHARVPHNLNRSLTLFDY